MSKPNFVLQISEQPDSTSITINYYSRTKLPIRYILATDCAPSGKDLIIVGHRLILKMKQSHQNNPILEIWENYLFNDFNLIVDYCGQEMCLSNFINIYSQYNDLVQSLIISYNVDFLNANPSVGLLMKISEPDPEMVKLYNFNPKLQLSSDDNHGINLKFTKDYEIPPKSLGYTIDFGVSCQSPYSQGYFLIPRSSIGKTPLRQANSIGLIESSYRGNLMVKVDNLSVEPYTIQKGESLFQLVLPSVRNQWQIQLVDNLGQTPRGTGGFGSTGK